MPQEMFPWGRDVTGKTRRESHKTSKKQAGRMDRHVLSYLLDIHPTAVCVREVFQNMESPPREIHSLRPCFTRMGPPTPRGPGNLNLIQAVGKVEDPVTGKKVALFKVRDEQLEAARVLTNG